MREYLKNHVRLKSYVRADQRTSSQNVLVTMLVVVWLFVALIAFVGGILWDRTKGDVAIY